MLRLLTIAIFALALTATDGTAAPTPQSSVELLEAANQAAAAVVLQGDDEEATADDETDDVADAKEAADAGGDSDEPSADEESDDEADGDDGDDEGEEEELDLHEVERRDFTVEVELDGVFIAEDMAEVALRPEVWSDFKVAKAVEHGARVRKGDVVVEFDERKFEQSLAQKSLDQRLGELALMQAEEELPRTEETIELGLTQAKREFDYLTDEYKRFQETVRPMSEKMAMRSLASSQFNLESAKEELEQLQQMYDADDLTEETEEIVLKRQKFTVASYELYLESAKINFDYTMDISLPRRDETYTLNLEAAKLALEQAKMDQSLGLTRHRYELEKLRESRERSVDEHAKLVADRTMMKLRAPIDGIAYYGRCIDGKFSEVGSLKSKLVPFGSISANTVVMTIVKEGAMTVGTEVKESDFPSIQQGQSAEVSLVADEDSKLSGSVEAISGIPQAGNKFAVSLEVDLGDAPDWLVPGMMCKARVTTYEVEDAVVIPGDLVQTDDEDDEVKYVMVLDEDGEAVRREIKLGEEDGDDVEVLEGLDEGDKVVKGAKDGDEDDDENGGDDEDEG